MEPHKSWLTEQDADEGEINHIAYLLCANPCVPPGPEDENAERDWEDAQSGIALPRAHCALRGCVWASDSKHGWEDLLAQVLLLQ